MAEKIIKQVLAVELGLFAAQPLLGRLHQLTNAAHLPDGLPRSLLDRPQHVEHPRFPCARVAHRLDFFVILRLVAHNVAAEVEHGQIQQSVQDEVEQVQDPPGPAVPVVKRMDALKLMVEHRHPHEWIGAAGFVAAMEVVEEVTRQPFNLVRSLRRLVDDRAGLLVF